MPKPRIEMKLVEMIECLNRLTQLALKQSRPNKINQTLENHNFNSNKSVGPNYGQDLLSIESCSVDRIRFLNISTLHIQKRRG